MKLFRGLAAAGVLLCALPLLTTPATAQCPAIGYDSGCGTVITINNTGATVTFTGQGPYDGIEDTLVGVVNNSRYPVYSLDLSASLDIFAFDGDGIDAYGVGGNGQDGSGYGGPNAYFSNLAGGGHSGRVNFIVPIAANGGTGYFSLENALSSATACSSVLNNSITVPGGGGTQISSVFTPRLNYTLAQAAQLCGFIEFDWQQTVTSLPTPSPFFGEPNCGAGATPLRAPPPFNDPPPQGYCYQTPPNRVELPVYYNLFTAATDPLSLLAHEAPAGANATSLSFFDAPADPCLHGGSGAGCGGHTAPAGSRLGFRTHLVGIQGFLPGADVVDTGIGFTWTDTYNGTNGGIAVLNATGGVDPGSGTGAIEVTSVNETTTYSGVTVTAVNGVAPGGALATLPAGNACNGVFSGTFQGDIHVTAGQNCAFVDGTITGNVEMNGGQLSLSDDLVEGSVNLHDAGTFNLSSFDTIEGALEIHNLPASDSVNQVCSVLVYQDLHVHDNAAAIQLGSTSDASCAGNVVVSDLLVHNNSGATTADGNTVTGDLEDHNNPGATQLFNDLVLGTLRCEGNAAISGGSDTAGAKTGQCGSF